ncbi:hypothetical protein LEF32_23455, partial [Salmonella enterica]|nr:hypothetical protein [Salmonella enterica]
VSCSTISNPKRRRKTKPKRVNQKLKISNRRGVRIMELGIMVCIVLLLSLAAVWISNKTVGLLEIHYFKRPLSMEYAAWLRVMCAGLLFIFIQMVPAFTFLYTLKLVALLNLGVQTMKLNGVYKFKRTGMMPPKDAPHDLGRFNPFRKK